MSLFRLRLIPPIPDAVKSLYLATWRIYYYLEIFRRLLHIPMELKLAYKSFLMEIRGY